MKTSQVIPAFEALLQQAAPDGQQWPEDELLPWTLQARHLLESVLPSSHLLLRRWNEAINQANRHTMVLHHHHLPESVCVRDLQSIFATALTIMKGTGLQTLVDGVRAESVSEVLDQAENLANAGHLAAAVVLVGGALEMHLRRLCERHGLTWNGEGSLSKYRTALDSARISGNEVVSVTDGKQIEAWAGSRNSAAHSPGTFSMTPEGVDLFLRGVRQFIARSA